MRVSVAMTTYRPGRHLDAQLTTIATQSRLPDELVISDDASGDDTADRLAAFAQTAPFPVRIHVQPENVGLRRNVEHALVMCSGDVIVLADQDDEWSPEKVSALVAAFTDPEVTLWFSDADLIDEDGQPWQRRAWEPVTFDASAQAELMAGSAMRLLHGQTVTGATMAIRASVLEAALPLPVDMDKGKSSLFLHDGWLAVVASTFGRVLVDPRPLTRYRQHAKQVTGMGMIVGNRIGPPGTPLEIDTARATAVAAVAGPNAAGDEVRATAAFLRDRRGSRVAIIRRLLSGDYSRHARGSRTALRDLLRT